MPEATQDIHDSQDIDAGVSALVSDVEAARPQGVIAAPPPAGQPVASIAEVPPAAAVEKPVEVAEPKPVAAAPSSAAVVTPAPAAVETPTEPATAATPSAAAPSTVDPAPAAAQPAAPAPEPDLAKAVEDLLIDAQGEGSKSPAPSPAPTRVATETGRIDSLDAELAGLADDLISGEFADEAQVMAEAAQGPAVPVVEAAIRAAESSAPRPLAGEVHKPEVPRAVFAPAAAPGPVRPGAKPEPKPAVAPASPEEAAPVAPTRGTGTRLGTALGALSGGVRHALGVLSVPLRNRPQHIRDIVGWFAVVNAFLALCVWGYLLLFPRTATLTPRARPAPVQEAAAEPAQHGEKKAEKPAKEHTKEKPKASSKKTAAASKGGSHH